MSFHWQRRVPTTRRGGASRVEKILAGDVGEKRACYIKDENKGTWLDPACPNQHAAAPFDVDIWNDYYLVL